jgi:hypothetical protein
MTVDLGECSVHSKFKFCFLGISGIRKIFFLKFVDSPGAEPMDAED